MATHLWNIVFYLQQGKELPFLTVWTLFIYLINQISSKYVMKKYTYFLGRHCHSEYSCQDCAISQARLQWNIFWWAYLFLPWGQFRNIPSYLVLTSINYFFTWPFSQDKMCACKKFLGKMLLASKEILSLKNTVFLKNKSNHNRNYP